MLYKTQELVHLIAPSVHITQNPWLFRLDRALSKLFGREDVTYEVTTPDGDVYAVPRSMHPNDVRGIKKGTYESSELQVMRKNFKPADAIIDVGSNIGYIARHAFREHLTHGGTIICAEPNPESQQALWLNKVRTAAMDRGKYIKTFNFAVAGQDDQGTTAQFNIRPNLGSGLEMVNGKGGAHRKASVKVRSLSSVMDQYLPGTRVSLVCDAEGGEIPIIFNDKAAFERIDQICIELHDQELTKRDVSREQMADAIIAMGFTKRDHVRNTYFFSRQP